MTVETLEQLSVAFADWRRGKGHQREKIPAELLERARRMTKKQGLGRVARALGLDTRRLRREQRVGVTRSAGTCTTPSYSRVELTGPAPAARPFAELELPRGIKIRLFSETPRALELISAVCAGSER